jgi:hypothetical protein
MRCFQCTLCGGVEEACILMLNCAEGEEPEVCPNSSPEGRSHRCDWEELKVVK